MREFVSTVEGDEELAGVVVPVSIGHAYQTTPVELETRVELVLCGGVRGGAHSVLEPRSRQ